MQKRGGVLEQHPPCELPEGWAVRVASLDNYSRSGPRGMLMRGCIRKTSCFSMNPSGKCDQIEESDAPDSMHLALSKHMEYDRARHRPRGLPERTS